MERNEIESKLRTIIADNLNIDESRIKSDSRLEDEFHVGSLDMVEIIMNVEGEFEIEIYDNELEELETLSKATDLVISKLDKK